MSFGGPEYSNKTLEDWTENDVAEWLEDNDLFYGASLPMKEIDGRSMCELLLLLDQLTAAKTLHNWHPYLKSNFGIDSICALRFTYSLRQLLKQWKTALKNKNADSGVNELHLMYP